MIFERLRPGCKGFIRPFIDRPDIRIPIIFYRVPPDRPVFPLATRFTFDTWTDDGFEEDFPGFEKSTTYYSGAPLNQGDGSHYCGTPDQWLNGCMFADARPAVDPFTGIPACCGEAPLRLAGGNAEGGTVYGLPVMVGNRGGNAQGGTVYARRPFYLPGGNAEGGEVEMLGFSSAYGGNAQGGVVRSKQYLAIDGGNAEGGTSIITRPPSLSVVQTWPAVSTGNGNVSVTTGPSPSPVTAGNAVVLIIWDFCPAGIDRLTGTASDSRGNTYLGRYGSGIGRASGLAVFGAANVMGGPGVTITYHEPSGNTGFISATACEVSGLGSTPALDGAANGASGVANTAGPFTTTNVVDLVLLVLNYTAGITAFMPPTGFTTIGTVTTGNVHEDGAAAYQITSTTQSGVTLTFGSTGDQHPFWLIVPVHP